MLPCGFFGRWVNVAAPQRLEGAFQARLASVAAGREDGVETPNGRPSPATARSGSRRGPPIQRHRLGRPRRRDRSPVRSRSGEIDKTVLALPEPRRIWDRDQVQYVTNQASLPYFAVASHAMLIIRDLVKAGSSAVRSPTSSLFRCVASPPRGRPLRR